MSFRTHVTLVVQQQTNGPALSLVVAASEAGFCGSNWQAWFLSGSILPYLSHFSLSFSFHHAFYLFIVSFFATCECFHRALPSAGRKGYIWLVSLVTFHHKEFGNKSSYPVTSVTNGWCRVSCFWLIFKPHLPIYPGK